MILLTISAWDVIQHVKHALAQIMMTVLNAQMGLYKSLNILVTQSATLKILT